MDLKTLESRQASELAPVVQQVEYYLSGFVGMKLTPSLWRRVLAWLFTLAEPAARASASLAREFYDAQRSAAFPGIPRNDLFLSLLDEEQFVRDMSEVRGMFVNDRVTEGAVHRAALRVARSVENSGRWTMMHAVEAPDPWLDGELEWDDDSEFTVSEASPEESRRRAEAARARRGGIRGWARVATGRETCGWCLMLVSRGPVYRSAQSAGGVKDARGKMKGKSFDPDVQMRQWHDGCDCKIVPVFDLKNWEGRDRYLAAEEMWKRETVGFSGKDAVNAFRRAANAGSYVDYLRNV